jgi:hypothetical protein
VWRFARSPNRELELMLLVPRMATAPSVLDIQPGGGEVFADVLGQMAPQCRTRSTGPRPSRGFGGTTTTLQTKIPRCRDRDPGGPPRSEAVSVLIARP